MSEVKSNKEGRAQESISRGLAKMWCIREYKLSRGGIIERLRAGATKFTRSNDIALPNSHHFQVP